MDQFLQNFKQKMLENKIKTSLNAQNESESALNGINKTHACNRYVRRLIIKQQTKYGRIRVIILVLVVLLTIYYLSFVMDSFDQPKMSVNVSSNDNLDYKSKNTTILEEPDRRYLTYGPECKIPNLDPFAKDVMTFFHKQNHR